MSTNNDHLLCVIRDDIRAIFLNDPAARNLAEVLLYPGLHAILLHRLAHASGDAACRSFPA